MSNIPDIYQEDGHVLFSSRVAAAYLGIKPGALRNLVTRDKLDPYKCEYTTARRSYFRRQELALRLDDRDPFDADEAALEAADVVWDWSPEGSVEAPASDWSPEDAPAEVLSGSVVTSGVTGSTPSTLTDPALRNMWETYSEALVRESDAPTLAYLLSDAQREINAKGYQGAMSKATLIDGLKAIGLAGTEEHRKGKHEAEVELFEMMEDQALGQLLNATLIGPAIPSEVVQQLAERAFGPIYKYVQEQAAADDQKNDRRLAYNR